MNTTAASPNLQVSTETYTVVANIELDGVNTLKAEEITTTYKVTRDLCPQSGQPFKVVAKKKVKKVVKPMSFNLVEVTSEELYRYRKMKIPSFVLKVDGKLYYSRIPDNLPFISSTILGAHMCAHAGYDCNRLSATSDEQGGCAKVRGLSKRIEKYPWITTGYETFNTKSDSFVVVNCLHYKKCPPRKKLSITEVNNRRVALAQFVWDDVRTIADVRARKEKHYDNIGTF